MASPAGFEPATPGLGIQCSILLSYEDVAALIAREAWGYNAPASPPEARRIPLFFIFIQRIII